MTIFTKCNIFMGGTWKKRRFYSYSEKEPKGEILDINWAKTQYSTETIFTKSKVFLCEAHPLFWFFVKKCKILDKITQKHNVIQDNFHTMPSFIWEVCSLYFALFCKKIEQKLGVYTEFEQKLRKIQCLFSQNVTFFMWGTWSERRFYS